MGKEKNEKGQVHEKREQQKKMKQRTAFLFGPPPFFCFLLGADVALP
jgi:hypothetical protein